MSQLTDALIEKAIQLLGIPVGQYSGPYAGPAGVGSEYWWGQLTSSYDNMQAAMSTTDITVQEVDALTPETAYQYVAATYWHIQQVAGALLDALKRGSFSDAITTIPRMQLRATVVAIFIYTSSGMQLHLSGAFERGIAAGRITEKQAIDHLNRCLDISSAIQILAGKNALQIINEPAAATQGLGQAWEEVLGAGTILVGSFLTIVLILGVIFVIAWAYNQHYVQQRALDECDKLLEQGDATGADKCRQNVMNANNAPMNQFMSSLLSPIQAVGWTTAIGIALFVGIKYILPAVEERRARPALGGA